MHSILCEGRYDVCFFDQVSIERNIRTHPTYDLNKYLELASPMCSHYIKINNPLIILGDNGKFDACNKYLTRIVKNKLGKFEEDILIVYIVDSDYCSDDILISKLSEILDSLRSGNSFMNKISIIRSKNEFVLEHPNARHKIFIKTFTIPESLEKKVMHYYCSKYGIKNKEQSPHEFIDNIARKHYCNDREKMFREVAEKCGTEEWVTKIFKDLPTQFSF
ncbi:MAG: hypothetical protein ACPK85_11835 [Methanosarcina sp.]